MTSGTEPPIAALVPHAGLMCLLERVLDWDERHLRAATATHRRADNPLRRDGRLDPVCLCEYGAQAMAVHGGLLAHRDGGRAAPGMLVSLREVWLAPGTVEALPGELEVSAERLHGDASGWQYAFVVTHQGEVRARGRAAVVLRGGGAQALSG
ncbi:MAG: phosphotransferase [Proteobacteria bacterium]|nr:phosphotransferase [Pseudomonadota bacterium]